MSSVIRQLKNWFTKQNIYPQTVEQAIYDSEGRRLDNKIANGLSNPNLLINADFRNPVNQRGGSSHNTLGYFIDRWYQWEDYGTITIEDDGLLFDASSIAISFAQSIEFPDKYAGRTFTFQLCITPITNSSKMFLFIDYSGEVNDGLWYNDLVSVETKIVKFTFTLPKDGVIKFKPSIYIPAGSKIKIHWAKLEEGEIATPFRPRLYAEELQLCKRYFQVIYQNATNIPWYDDNNFRFYIQFEQRMRSVPTVILPSNSAIVFGQYKNCSTQIIDATVKADEINQSKCRLVATKENHGYPSALLYINGIWVDAEL